MDCQIQLQVYGKEDRKETIEVSQTGLSGSTLHDNFSYSSKKWSGVGYLRSVRTKEEQNTAFFLFRSRKSFIKARHAVCKENEVGAGRDKVAI